MELEDNGLVCVELQYQDNVWDFNKGIFKGPSKPKTGSLLMSSNITKSGKLRRVVCEMCLKMGWTPLVYRIIESNDQVRSNYMNARRVLTALS